MSAEPTEEQLRAYEEELSRLTSTEIVIQAAASLISIGGRRLGMAGGGEQERDLEQVRDAIDGARALLPILERRMPAAQVGQLRGALSQLQMGYATLAQGAAGAPGAAAAGAAAGEPGASAPAGGPAPAQAPADGGTAGGETAGGETAGGEQQPARPAAEDTKEGPGPAESSGRLWVPGR